MKKLFAAAAVLAALALLASCSGRGENATTLSYEEEISSIEAARETTTADLSSIAAERDVIANEIGKTTPNEKLVLCITKSSWYQYEVVFFDDDGMSDYRLVYYFYNTRRDYNAALDYKDLGFEDIQEKNKELLMIVDKNKNIVKSTYEDYYTASKKIESERRIVIE